MTRHDDDAWFAPKAFGYGAGLPIAWQGWAVLLAYLGVLLASGFALMPAHRLIFFAVAVVATAVLVVIAARHTRGGWKWRWRGDA